MRGYDNWKTQSPDDERPSYDDLADDYCPKCGGEGVIYMCLDGIGCIDPGVGCELCERRCDWCNPRRAALTDPAETPEGAPEQAQAAEDRT